MKSKQGVRAGVRDVDKTQYITEAKDKALTCYCMECATCLCESDYNAAHYAGKRFVAMLTSKIEVVVMRNHHTCSWCKFGLDIREASLRIVNSVKGVYVCPTCLRNNGFRLYRQTDDVMRETRNDYYVLQTKKGGVVDEC